MATAVIIVTYCNGMRSAEPISRTPARASRSKPSLSPWRTSSCTMPFSTPAAAPGWAASLGCLAVLGGEPDALRPGLLPAHELVENPIERVWGGCNDMSRPTNATHIRTVQNGNAGLPGTMKCTGFDLEGGIFDDFHCRASDAYARCHIIATGLQFLLRKAGARHAGRLKRVSSPPQADLKVPAGGREGGPCADRATPGWRVCN
jgi:hypothetical protein